jgi:hypothetical protein
MMPPTIANLEFLARFERVADAMDQARQLPPPRSIMPKVQFDASGKIVGIVLPDQPGYSELP